MINLFSKANLEECINKEPLILFYSGNGSMGPSGLMFVVFSDFSCYCYSTYYDELDLELLRSIIEHVPEFNDLIGMKGEMNFKRNKCDNQLEDFYLGVGNFLLARKEIVDEIEESEEFPYTYFNKKIVSLINNGIDDIYKKVEMKFSKKIMFE